MGIKEFLAKSLGYRLGGPQTGSSIMEMTEMKLPPAWGYQSYLKAYGEVGWLFACVNVIANAVARQPWHLYQIDSNDDRVELFDHPLIDLWNNPNPFQTRYQYVYLATMYKKLVGEEFWQINFNSVRSPKSIKYYENTKLMTSNGQPAQMWLAPPAYMSVIPSPTDYIDHYEYKRTGMSQPVLFSVDEIIHIMTPNPHNPYRGLSEAQALTTIIDSERYAANYQQKLFFNEGVPGFIIKYPAQDLPNMESRKELVQEWDERYKGFRNRGKTAFLWGGEPSTITLSNRDMDFKALRDFGRDAILGAYSVPKSVLGLTEASTYASAKAGNYTFAYYVIHPELCALREAVNKELCPLFGDNLELDFENPVPEDEAMQVTNATALFKAGLARRNEARIMVDLEPIDTPEGEEFFVAPQSVGFGAPGATQEDKPTDNSPIDETPEKDEGKGLKKKTYTESEAEAIWKAYVKTSEPYEKQLITALNDIFAKTQEEILTKIKAGEHNALIDKVDIRNGYTAKATPILTECMKSAISNGKRLIEPENPHKDGPGIMPVLNVQAVEWLKKRIAWAADQIGETLSKELADSLAEGFTAGESIDELTDRVMEFFGDAVRSERIARTETISASAQGTLEGYKETGVVRKVTFWAAEDERTCDLCNTFHNKDFTIGEEPAIAIHPGCRCVYLPVIE